MEDDHFKAPPGRSKDDYWAMTHSPLLNHFRTETAKLKDETSLNKISAFFAKRLWTWFYYYISSRFGRNHRYNTYTFPDPGVYSMKSQDGAAPAVRIAVTGDWGTDTAQSCAVAKSMAERDPDYTIHLGDTYYVGAPHEIEQNFTNPGSPWVRGKKGSFALLGNHEMYARGIAFFDRLLPTLGIRDESGSFTGQKASFFCLENDYWRILGLDTGYHSIGRIPLLELIPGFGPDAHLDKALLLWLYDDLKLDDINDKRGLIILSHHQYITAFGGEAEFLVPAEQLAKIIGKERPVLWLWGHEHKFSVYAKAQVREGITAYGRCIGHGGMPIEIPPNGFKLGETNHGSSKLVMVDTRNSSEPNSTPLGYNGYALLSLTNEQLEIEYHDINGKLFSENWTADITTGNIKGEIRQPIDSGLTTIDNRPWTDAVK